MVSMSWLKWLMLASLILQGTNGIPFPSTIILWKRATCFGILQCLIKILVHYILYFYLCYPWTSLLDSLFSFPLEASLCPTLTLWISQKLQSLTGSSLFLFLSSWDAQHDVQGFFWSYCVSWNETDMTFQQYYPLLITFKSSENKHFMPFIRKCSWVNW